MSQAVQSFQLVLTTAGSREQAAQIARDLVERRLAACVNVVHEACSIYRWKGEVQEETEHLLLIKTEARLVESVMRRVRELHTYDVPELLAIPLCAGDADYLGWLTDNLAPDAEPR